MKLPVKLISRARRTPIACGSSTVRPQPGITPTRVWVSPNLARSEAIRKSQLSASSKPPVMATPLIAPISGLVDVRERAARAGRLRVPSAPLPAAEVAARRAQLLQVEAGAERRVGTGEDEHIDVVAGVGVVHHRRQQRAAARSTARCGRSGRLSVIVAMRSLTSSRTGAAGSASVVIGSFCPLGWRRA